MYLFNAFGKDRGMYNVCKCRCRVVHKKKGMGTLTAKGSQSVNGLFEVYLESTIEFD